MRTLVNKRRKELQKEYKIMVAVYGTASKTVLANSQEEAERAVEKMLFQQDRQTPSAKMLCAFDWDIPSFHTYCKEMSDSEQPLMIED